jgi:lincosamide nucleotidyltransferase A/C/D/E
LEVSKPWNFVLADDFGHEIDVHVAVFDVEGNGLYGPLQSGVMYPADSLTGTGTIGGYKVRCISPEWMVKHSRYEFQERDFKDVSALCTRFEMALPEEYGYLRIPKR